MAKDVLITPASGNVEFKLNNVTKAALSLDDSNNLVLSSVDGDVSIGTPGTNVFIGDGVNSVDVIFEQNGAIRALTGKTLTLGQSDSFITVSELATVPSLRSFSNTNDPAASTTMFGRDSTQSIRMHGGSSGNFISSLSSSTNPKSLIIRANRGTTNRDFVFDSDSGILTATGFSGTLTSSEINKSGTNGTGNIGQSNNAFNTVFAKATSAQYADVAEKYQADADYPPGTVLIFGGSCEVTASIDSHTAAIAGIVSTDPAYIMNSGLESAHVATVALLGRVPCRVVGPISKGQCVVASNQPGVATALDPALYQPGCVIGKALEDYHSDQPGTIEVVAGRL